MKERPSRIYALGPEGTFSDQAAQRVAARYGAPLPPVTYTRTIPEVLSRTEAEAGTLGIIPIENSVAGTVTPAQDGLASHQLTILWEIALPVRFSLAATGPLEQVRVYYAHPQAFGQCTAYLAAHLPGGQVSFTNSNTESAAKLLQTAPAGSPGRNAAAPAPPPKTGDAAAPPLPGNAAPPADTEPCAAIVPYDYGREHPAHIVAEDIQDFPNNTTRFLVARRAKPPEKYDFTRQKTSLLIVPEKDYPGLLHDLLNVFNRHQMNLIRLESRPFKVTPWTYVFYIDIDNNPHSEQCVADLRTTPNQITVLGSYDRLE